VDSVIFDDGSGQVGISMGTPAVELDVGGTINAQRRLTVEGNATSDCCVVHAPPGCDDTACQTAVCAIDATCCSNTWSQVCQGYAASECVDVCPFGDDFVSVPNDSISAPEILDEGGATTKIFARTITLSTGINVLESTVLEAPAAGYALVVANATLSLNHISGIQTGIRFGVSKSNSALPPQQQLNTALPTSLPTGVHLRPVSTHALFSVPKGFTTFYALADWYSGANFTATDVQLSAVFVPSSYGDVPDPTSDCCVANGSAGCDTMVCESTVCSIDTFCCDTEWDSICAGYADEVCVVCAD